MMPSTEPNAETIDQHKRDVTKLREAAKQIGVDRFGDGTWFQRVVAKHVRKHLAATTAQLWDERYPGLPVEVRARREIKRVALKASVAGVLASTGASTGEILALVTEGMAAPVGLPAAILSMTLEAAYTSLLQVDLACDLASIYGVPFDADDVGEVTTLFGLAFDVDMKKRTVRHAEDGRTEHETEGLTSKLQELEEGEVAKRIGRKLMEDAVVRNIVPFLGIPVSARWNYVATKRLGKTVKKYVRYRHALALGCSGLRLDTIADPATLVEGAWLLATTDGDAGHEEVMALALIMDKIPEAQRREIELDKSLGDDEEEWFEALARAPASLHEPLLDVFYLIAATDREIQAAERRFLRRVGKTIGRTIDFDRLERICRHLDSGEALPPGTLHCG
jgi:hypothetical protein